MGSTTTPVHSAFVSGPNERAIEFVTVNAAAALGLGDVTGRVAPGSAADLLVVRDDPLANLSAQRDVQLVITPHTHDLPPH